MSIGHKTALMSAFAFVAAFTVGMAITANESQAQSGCKWYATTALKQQQLNEKNKCGFSDAQQWHSDLGKHMAWCASVSPDKWKAAAKTRSQQLADCVK